LRCCPSVTLGRWVGAAVRSELPYSAALVFPAATVQHSEEHELQAVLRRRCRPSPAVLEVLDHLVDVRSVAAGRLNRVAQLGGAPAHLERTEHSTSPREPVPVPELQRCARHVVDPHRVGFLVERLQVALRTRGYDPGPTDGDYGPRTARAVRAYQIDRGLVPDGEAGPITLGALGVS